jgi:hypothetical protein
VSRLGARFGINGSSNYGRYLMAGRQVSCRVGGFMRWNASWGFRCLPRCIVPFLDAEFFKGKAPFRAFRSDF